MNAICTQENLENALFALERVVGKQSSLPILSNILIETEKGQLKLSATNLEIGVVVSLGAKIEKEGKITVPAKLLSTFIQNLPSGQLVELHQEGLTLYLKSERHQVSIKGLDGKDFPIIPRFRGEYEFVLPAQGLKEAFQKVLFSVSLNESRVELTGVQCLFEEGLIAFAATDSFRLSEYRLPLEKGKTEGYDEFCEKNPSLLIPSATLQEVLRVIGVKSADVTVAVEENQLFFNIDGIEIISRLINGRYPDYQQIIPKAFSQKATMKKEALVRALKMATSFSLYSSGEVKFVFNGEKHEVTVSAESQEVGTNETTLDFKGSLTESGPVVFNPRYILEGVNALPGENVVFSFNSPTTPVLIEAEEIIPFLYIVMPIRK
ncbi:MAG: DNA polymerase III subunit beta [Candidatus Moraniibacteriota bacterium]